MEQNQSIFPASTISGKGVWQSEAAIDLTKVTVFGDSISKGLYLEDGHIRRIERSAVRLLSEKYGVQLDNFSVFGQTLKKCWEQGHFLRWMSDHANQGAILVVCMGGNDCDYDWQEVAKDPFLPHKPKTPIAEFEYILHALIEQSKRHNIRLIFTSLPPIDSRRYFENVISRRADGARVMEFFRGDVTNISRHQECYNAAVLKAALSGGCTFLDFRSELLLRYDFLSCLSDDGIHPNQTGHEAIAAYIERVLTDVLERRSAN